MIISIPTDFLNLWLCQRRKMSEVIVETTELLSIFKTGVTQSVALVEYMPDLHRVEAWKFWKEISKLVVLGVEEVIDSDGVEVPSILCLNSNSNSNEEILEPAGSISDQNGNLSSTGQESVRINESGEENTLPCVTRHNKLGSDTPEPHINGKQHSHMKEQKLVPETPENQVRKSKRKPKSSGKIYESLIPKYRKRLTSAERNRDCDFTTSAQTEKKTLCNEDGSNTNVTCHTHGGLFGNHHVNNKADGGPDDYDGRDDVSLSETSSSVHETLKDFKMYDGPIKDLCQDDNDDTCIKAKPGLNSNVTILKNAPSGKTRGGISDNVKGNVSSDIEIVDPVEIIKTEPAFRVVRNAHRHGPRLKKTKMTKEERCTCPVCGKVLSNYSNLKVHLRSHSGEKPFMCMECGRKFTTRPNLVRHERTHRGEKPFKCPDCHKCFTENKSMRIHRRIHTGELPYKCQMCPARFNQSGTLAAHMNIHTGTKSHLCDLCGKAFRQKTQLRLHYLRHDNIRNHSCSICQKAFVSKGELDRHAVRHSGERRYKCNVCPKKFTRSQYVKEHMNKHTGAKPFPCKLCGLRFSDLASCTHHQNKHEDKMQLLAKIDGEETYVVYLDAEQLLQASSGEKALVLGENGTLNLQDDHVGPGSQHRDLCVESTHTVVADRISSETSFLVEIQNPPPEINASGKGELNLTTTATTQRLELDTLLFAEQLKDSSNVQISEVASVRSESVSDITQEPVLILQSSEEV